jgi:hypothetical protein
MYLYAFDVGSAGYCLPQLATGKSALFSRHPQMKNWPANHHFGVYGLVDLTDVWVMDTCEYIMSTS